MGLKETDGTKFSELPNPPLCYNSQFTLLRPTFSHQEEMSLNISEVYVVPSFEFYFLVSLWGCRETSKGGKCKVGPHIVQEEINQTQARMNGVSRSI